MPAPKIANDNHRAYWSQPVLDRARELTARREARKRAAARADLCPACRSPRAQSPAPHWRLWDDLGMPVQYGLTVTGALVLLLAAMELLALGA